jgi:hypothetical protein
MIFVDEIRRYGDGRERAPFQDGSCVLTTDGDESELHEFARRLGLHPDHFEPRVGSLRFPHYQITPSKRAYALALGATYRPTRELIARARASRGAA